MKKALSLIYLLIVATSLLAQVSKTVDCTAGALSSLLTAEEKSTVTDLTITGVIDARDFKTMRDSMGVLEDIDMSGSTISAYTGGLGTSGNSIYSENMIPDWAFSRYEQGKQSLVSIINPSSVTKIGQYAYYHCTNLVSINIPITVTYISNFAFGECRNISTLNIPSSVTTIQYYPFYDCGGDITVDLNNPNYTSADGVLFNKTKTTLMHCPTSKGGKYIVPSTVSTIGVYAFYNCNELDTIEIPTSVTTIKTEAFEKCSALRSIVIPTSVTSIEYGAFRDCTGLTTLTLPPAITTISAMTFSGCIGLTSISFSSTLTSIGDYAFEGCKGLEVLSFPSTLKSIGRYAFIRCDHVTSVTIPSSVTSIGEDAFLDCSGIITVNSANSTYSSLNGVLFNKAKTTLIHYPNTLAGNYVIPTSVTTLTYNSFTNCKKLTSVSIPASVTSIGSMNFAGCDGNILVNASNPTYSSLDGVLFNKAFTSLIHCPISKKGDYEIPATVVSINNQAFMNCDSLTSIVLPTILEVIDFGAFMNCKSLVSITLPKTVTFINGNAFDNCIGLQSIYALALTPLDLFDASIFNNVDRNTCTVYVPIGSLVAYRKAEVWKDFLHIEEIPGITLSKDSLAFSPEGGVDSILLYSDRKWTISSDQPWLTYSPLSGEGNDTLIISSGENTTLRSRNALLTVTGENIEPILIPVRQEAYTIMSVDISKKKVSPIVDGVIDPIWADIQPISISKNYKNENPTITAYWKALWNDNGIYVMIHIEDDDHYPAWKSGGNDGDYDCPRIYWDVNDTLQDGLGVSNLNSGHYQSLDTLKEDGYGSLHVQLPTDQNPGGNIAYRLNGENYIVEHFFPFDHFKDKDGVVMDKNGILSRSGIGFDIILTDQDEGITSTPQRLAWQNKGTVAEAYDNMDRCGIIQLIGEPNLEGDSLALIALYNSAKGTGWKNKTNWLTGPVKNWFGVTVSNNRVSNINLRYNNLKGEIPPEIGNLTALQTLNLSDNYYTFSGIIPETIGDLTELTSLDLSSNGHTGRLPAGLYNLTKLTTLDVGYNWDLTGSISNNIKNLRSLTSLNIAGCEFTGVVPTVLDSLVNLTTLDISSNSYTPGPMPYLGHLTKLTTLSLAGCRFTGSISPSILQLTNLVSLDVSSNSFSTAAMPNFSSLINLKTLKISNCNFTGDIPSSLMTLNKITALEISNNPFTHTITPDFSPLTNLIALRASNCNFIGGIPPSIFHLPNLEILYLDNNKLSGAIPAEIGDMPKISSLYISNNKLSGQIPPEFGNLTKIWALNLSGNQLSGPLPSTFGNLAGMRYCYLNKNRLSGNLPESFSKIIANSLNQIKTPGNKSVAIEADSINYFSREKTLFNEGPEKILTSLYRFEIQNNKYTFANLLASGYKAADVDYYYYSPQDTLLTIQQERNTLIANDCQSPLNKITWYKDNVALSENARAIAITSGGNYHFTVTNTSYPLLTLFSDTLWFEPSAIENSLQLSDTIVMEGEIPCFNAYDTITVAGDGSLVEFQSGSSVDLIAGSTIRFLPGFHASEGSFAHAWITADGMFCDGASESIVENPQPEKSGDAGVTLPAGDGQGCAMEIKVYPNPNSGRFSVEMIKAKVENKAEVKVYNALGDRVYQAGMEDGMLTIDLSGIRRGLYVVMVTSGKERMSRKVMVE